MNLNEHSHTHTHVHPYNQCIDTRNTFCCALCARTPVPCDCGPELDESGGAASGSYLCIDARGRERESEGGGAEGGERENESTRASGCERRRDRVSRAVSHKHGKRTRGRNERERKGEKERARACPREQARGRREGGRDGEHPGSCQRSPPGGALKGRKWPPYGSPCAHISAISFADVGCIICVCVYRCVCVCIGADCVVLTVQGQVPQRAGRRRSA